MKKNHDVIVVGGGPGGTCCAALLAKKGLKVLLLEKNERVGGKGMRVSVKGFQTEMWPMNFIPVRSGPWMEAFKALGIESKLQVILGDIATYYRRPDGKWVHSITRMTDPFVPPDPNITFDQWDLNSAEREVALKLLADIATMPSEKIDSLDQTTVKEFLAQYEPMPWPIYSYMAYLTHQFNVGVIDLVPMSEITKAFQSLMSTAGGYPQGGYGRLVESMADVVKANGGEVKTRTRVERIIIEDGRASGVMTQDSVFRAPVVVSNAGIHPTVLKLVGEEHFDRSYVSHVRSLLPSLGFTGARYILSKPMLPHAYYQIWSENSWFDLARYRAAVAGEMPKDVTVSICIPTNYDPEMGPPGKQLLVLGTNCSPAPEDKTVKSLMKMTDEVVAEALPEIVPFIESKEGYAGPAQVSALTRDQVLPGQGGEAVGVGVTVGQCGKYKPSAKSPIPGLFYVGFDAGSTSGLMGTHQAVDSGLKVAQMIYHYQLERQQAAWE